MYSPANCSLAHSRKNTSLLLDYSVINREYCVNYEGVIGLYVQKTQLSIYIEIKDDIKGYTINPNEHKVGRWYASTLQRSNDHTNKFVSLRNTSEGYIEVSESLINLECFREMLNQETQVGFSNIKDINTTVQLALSELNSTIDFQYNPAQTSRYP